MGILNTVLTTLMVSHPSIQSFYPIDADEVLVCISWGEKHDHWLCDKMMEKIGYEKVQEVITESNGHTDRYSSEHTYIKNRVSEI